MKIANNNNDLYITKLDKQSKLQYLKGK